MKFKTLSATGAVAVTGALLLPGAAAAHIETGVKSVQAHTNRADAALERAAGLFASGKDAKAERSFNKSRSEMGRAIAEAAKLRRNAGTNSERAAAARARAIVARQQDENVEELVEVLDEARGRVENRIATAALSDTRGREKAIAVITALLQQGVPSERADGLTTALAALSQARDEEAREEAEALVSDDVSKPSKGRVARAIDASVDGQQTAAGKLAALIAGDSVPEQAKPGLQRAYDAVVLEHENVADVLSEFSDRMPAYVRSFVQEIVRQAREDAQGMRDNRPTPPSGGQPSETPGQPEGTAPAA